MGKIDETDMRILAELVKDASVSVPKLSRKIDVNPSVVYSRIKRLSRRKLIKRFTVIVNEDLLGYSVSSIMGLNIDSKLRENILDELLSLNEVREVSEVTGRFDLIVRAKAKSLDELHEVVVSKIGRINGLIHTETFVELKSRERQPLYSLSK